MLWFPTLSKNRFRSIIRDNDELSTGKWLVPIQVPDIGRVWEDLEDATVEGRLTAVKKSTQLLRSKIGHDLICVYCSASDADTVAETLAVLREIGVNDELRYKSDLATFEGRGEDLWSSNDFEGLALKAF
jgi:hypothetical protein